MMGGRREVEIYMKRTRARFGRLIVASLMFSLVGGCGGNSSIPRALPEPALQEIARLSANGNLDALLLLQEPSQIQRPALRLAILQGTYLSAIQKYGDRFVDLFPTDYVGIAQGVFEIMQSQAFPADQGPIQVLGTIAGTGNLEAARKIYLGYLHSDGEVASDFLDQMTTLLLIRPRESLEVLRSFSSEEYGRVLLGLKSGISEHEHALILLRLRSLDDLPIQLRQMRDKLLQEL